MALLPDSTDYTDAAATQGDKKTFVAALRTFVAGLLGTDTSSPSTALKLLGAFGSSAPSNLALAASVAGNALTIAIKGADGTDPSATNPVTIPFRNVTPGTGDFSVLSLTAATSLTISSGSTLGSTSGVAFRAWIVGFNDAGTFRLGVINCANSSSIYPLRDGALASSTAEGGAGAADAAKTFYTGSAVTSKVLTVLGYFEYSSGLATAGTYNAVPTKLQLFGPGVPLPGSIVQAVNATYGSSATSSSSTFADTGLTASITPTAAPNKVLVLATQAGCYKDSSDTGVRVRLNRGATALLEFEANAGKTDSAATSGVGSTSCSYMDSPGSASALSYKTQFASRGNTANAYVQQADGNSSMTLLELAV
jgi:hypothetical protein